MKRGRVTEEEIMSKQTARGGWTKAQLAEWGIGWPPPKGWKRKLEKAIEAERGHYELDKQCDDARDRDHTGPAEKEMTKPVELTIKAKRR
jgi:hypothetical protein